MIYILQLWRLAMEEKPGRNMMVATSIHKFDYYPVRSC